MDPDVRGRLVLELAKHYSERISGAQLAALIEQSDPKLKQFSKHYTPKDWIHKLYMQANALGLRKAAKRRGGGSHHRLAFASEPDLDWFAQLVGWHMSVYIHLRGAGQVAIYLYFALHTTAELQRWFNCTGIGMAKWWVNLHQWRAEVCGCQNVLELLRHIQPRVTHRQEMISRMLEYHKGIDREDWKRRVNQVRWLRKGPKPKEKLPCKR